MAQIKQVGIGRKSTGTIDGITYYVRNGKTFARSAPTMPASAYTNPEAKVRQAIFKMVQMHMKYHLRTIRQTITAKNGSPSNRYYSLNKKGLGLALQTLAEQAVEEGLDVTITDVEQAICDYAAEHPTSIKIASKSGYQEVYLTGPWPSTITLNALAGDSTVIIIVNEYGVQTTIAADGTVTTEQYQGSNGSSNGSSSSSGSSGSSGSSAGGSSTGSDTGSGSGTSGTGGSSTPSTGSGTEGSETGGGSNDNANENQNGGGSSTGSETGGSGSEGGDSGSDYSFG